MQRRSFTARCWIRGKEYEFEFTRDDDEAFALFTISIHPMFMGNDRSWDIHLQTRYVQTVLHEDMMYVYLEEDLKFMMAEILRSLGKD